MKIKHCNAKNGCLHENDENTTYCEGINCPALILGHEFSEFLTVPSLNPAPRKNPARTPQDIQPNEKLKLEQKENMLVRLVEKIYSAEQKKEPLDIIDGCMISQYLEEYKNLVSQKICGKVLDIEG